MTDKFKDTDYQALDITAVCGVDIVCLKMDRKIVG